MKKINQIIFSAILFFCWTNSSYSQQAVSKTNSTDANQQKKSEEKKVYHQNHLQTQNGDVKKFTLSDFTTQRPVYSNYVSPSAKSKNETIKKANPQSIPQKKVDSKQPTLQSSPN